MRLARLKSLILSSSLLRSPLARRLARGGLWNLLGDSGARILAFIGAVLAARLLGVAEYGAFVLVQATLGMMMTFAQFGMGQTSTRYIAAERDRAPERLEAIVGLTLVLALAFGLMAALVLALGAGPIASGLLGNPQLAAALRLSGLVLLAAALGGAFSGILAGFEAFGILARIAWLGGLANLAGLVAGVWLAGVEGAVAGLALAEGFRCAMLAFHAVGAMRQRDLAAFGRPNLSEIGLLWHYSLPLLLGTLLHAPVLWYCQTLIANRPGGLSQLALYDVAQKWMTLVILVPFAASAAISPVLANLQGTDGPTAARRTTHRLIPVQLALTALPAIVIAVLAEPLATLFGASFAAAVPVVQLTMLLAPIFVIRHLYWQAIMSGGHAWAALGNSLLWAVICLILTYLYRDEGAIGLVKAMIGAYGGALLASIVLAERLWSAGRMADGTER